MCEISDPIPSLFHRLFLLYFVLRGWRADGWLDANERLRGPETKNKSKKCHGSLDVARLLTLADEAGCAHYAREHEETIDIDRAPPQLVRCGERNKVSFAYAPRNRQKKETFRQADVSRGLLDLAIVFEFQEAFFCFFLSRLFALGGTGRTTERDPGTC